MVEHAKSADQIVAEAIAIHIDTEGPWEVYGIAVDMADLEAMLYWALTQVGVVTE